MINSNGMDSWNSYGIQVDAPGTMQKAKQLKQIAMELGQTDELIKKQIRYVERNWKGKAGEAMRERMTQTNAVNKTLIEELNQIAGRMEKVVGDILSADNASSQRSWNIGR